MRSSEFLEYIIQEKFDIIFHLGGNVDIAQSIIDPESDFITNAQVTINILETLRKHCKNTKFVYLSSIGVYGEIEGSINEKTLQQPISPYGASKLCGDHYCRIYAKLYGLKILIIRYGTVFGPGIKRQFIYDILKKIESLKNEIEIYGTGKQLRDLNYISNHIDGTIHIADKSNFDGSVYNLGYGKSYPIIKVVKILQKLMHSDARIKSVGKNRKGDVTNFIYNISKSKKLGYSPKISLYNGLQKTVEWFQEDWVSQNKLPSVSVVICTYNEKDNIQKSVDRIEPWLKKIAITYEIIFVDDSSPDKTADVIKKIMKRNSNVKLILRKNKEGIGAAQKQGIHSANGDIIITMDADLSQDPKEFIKFSYYLQHNVEMVIGSRYVMGSKIEGQPLFKRNASKVGNIIARNILQIPIKDLTHSYRAFYKKIFVDLKTKIPSNEHPNYILEFSVEAYRHKHKIIEIPVIFTEREVGSSKLNLNKAGKNFLKTLFKLSMWKK